MRVNILAEFTVAEENIEKAKALFEELERESLKEKGCLSYNLKQVSRQENCFIINEVFEDKAAQDLHKETKHYNNILKTQLEPLITEKKVRFLI